MISTQIWTSLNEFLTNEIRTTSKSQKLQRFAYARLPTLVKDELYRPVPHIAG